MSEKEVLTVAEYAKIKGVSKQAVYKQLKGKLKEFTTEVDGVVCLRVEALSEEEKTQLNEVEQQIEQPFNNSIQPLLEKQIEEKDKQIESLLRQIENLQKQNDKLTDLLNNSQMLLAAEKQLQLTEAASQEQEKTITEQERESESESQEQERKGLFRWFRRKGKKENEKE